MEKMGANLGRAFYAILGKKLSGLKHCNQVGRFLPDTPLDTELGVKSQPFCVI